MNSGDVQRIEAALGVTLPPTYVDSVVPFPVPALAGNTETGFWDDADALIELNLRLRKREGSRAPWPPRFFALGMDGGGCSDAVDLDDPAHGVFWFDRQHIADPLTDRSIETLAQWVLRQTRELTSDLMADGHDPNGSPEALKASQHQEASSSFGGCLFFIIIALVLLGLGFYIGRRH